MLRAIFCTGEQDELVRTLQRFRKTVFVDRERWALAVDRDREVDAYDRRDTVHMALFDADEVCATFRATRTDRPYLSADVFGHLATTEDYPRRHDAWEISRFGIASTPGAGLAGINYGLMLWWALQVDARSLVAVTELAHERLLRSIGITTLRYGRPGIVGWTVDGRPLRAVAGSIPVARQRGDVLSRLFQNLADVEIVDAADVFGCCRLSA
jgi:acyl homoserine lactone synthase